MYVPISLTSEDIIRKWRQQLRQNGEFYSEGGGVPFGSDKRTKYGQQSVLYI